MKDDKYIFTLKDAQALGLFMAEVSISLKILVICNIALATICLALSVIYFLER